eukprot:gene7382-biopygen6257
MPIRERIAHVLDRDSPFLEISPLAGWRSNVPVGSGFVVGIGVIEGVECVILGHDLDDTRVAAAGEGVDLLQQQHAKGGPADGPLSQPLLKRTATHGVAHYLL